MKGTALAIFLGEHSQPHLRKLAEVYLKIIYGFVLFYV
jgi:hypothetical protein